jgi:hypothetical protein
LTFFFFYYIIKIKKGALYMIIEDWNNDLGMAQCVIEDTSNNGVTLRGYGKATCHDDDE